MYFGTTRSHACSLNCSKRIFVKYSCLFWWNVTWGGISMVTILKTDGSLNTARNKLIVSSIFTYLKRSNVKTILLGMLFVCVAHRYVGLPDIMQQVWCKYALFESNWVLCYYWFASFNILSFKHLSAGDNVSYNFLNILFHYYCTIS